MKKLIAMLLALVMVLSLAACGASEPAATEAPKADAPANEAPEADAPAAEAASGKVFWLNFKPESDETLQNIAKMYTEETGVEVKVVTAASGTYNETLTAEMDKGDAAPTIFVVGNQPAVDQWGEYCYDLTGTAIEAEMNTEAYKLYDEDGKLCSLGYCYECFGIICNLELLEKAGYEKDYITNFATLKEVAEDVHARSAELGFDAFTSAGMDGSSSWRYTGHLINVNYFWEMHDDPAAWVAMPSTIKGTYMDNFRQLYDLMVVNTATDRATLANGGFDANAEFANGEALFYVNGNWEWTSLQEKGMTEDQLHMYPYYSGVEGEENVGLNAGTENYWAINSEASEEDIQASIDFLVWLVNDPEASALAVGTFGSMPYKNAAPSPNPFYNAANEYLTKGCFIMDTKCATQPNTDAYRATAVSALNTYNADPTDANWELVETAFVAGWATQYAAANG